MYLFFVLKRCIQLVYTINNVETSYFTTLSLYTLSLGLGNIFSVEQMNSAAAVAVADDDDNDDDDDGGGGGGGGGDGDDDDAQDANASRFIEDNWFNGSLNGIDANPALTQFAGWLVDRRGQLPDHDQATLFTRSVSPS